MDKARDKAEAGGAAVKRTGRPKGGGGRKRKSFEERLAELGELARRATAGEWEYYEPYVAVILAGGDKLSAVACEEKGIVRSGACFGKEQSRANARYIAAANPAMVLEMIEKLEDSGKN